jgi:hypothetical protein
MQQTYPSALFIGLRLVLVIDHPSSSCSGSESMKSLSASTKLLASIHRSRDALYWGGGPQPFTSLVAFLTTICGLIWTATSSFYSADCATYFEISSDSGLSTINCGKSDSLGRNSG